MEHIEERRTKKIRQQSVSCEHFWQDRLQPTAQLRRGKSADTPLLRNSQISTEAEKVGALVNLLDP
jgi:hypothetical protein